MPAICLYLHCHQPLRLKKFSVFDIGSSASYFDDEKNEAVLARVAQKCYLPANRLLLELIHRTGGKFMASLSISGVLLEQLENKFPEVLQSFKDLVDTGCCELISETYYHSLASIYSRREFINQVEKQNQIMERLFNFKPRFIRNTELVYNNDIAALAEHLGFEGILAEGWDDILQWRSPNYLYKAKNSNLFLLVRNYKLSDDIGFRFSNRAWKEWPLTAEKYCEWVNLLNIGKNAQILNLFMDYETFGEHHWEDTGIFKFLEAFCWQILKNPLNRFITPSIAAQQFKPVGELDFWRLVSWADTERDLSAWTGNDMQQAAIKQIYSLEEPIKQNNNKKLIDIWRKLQTSDHFYYMCTKWFADGDVHKYFNPYESPYESFITYMNICNDLKMRIKQPQIKKSTIKVG